jgi:hypothetical protein
MGNSHSIPEKKLSSRTVAAHFYVTLESRKERPDLRYACDWILSADLFYLVIHGLAEAELGCR